MPFLSKAYRHPAPMPRRKSGRLRAVRATKEGKCDRDYATCYAVCKRYPHRQKLDCEFDCHRRRRACYWGSQTKDKKIRKEFHEMLKIKPRSPPKRV